MFDCCICHQHARSTLVGVLRHIREVHPHFTSSVVCGLDGCSATPKTFQALRKHIYRYNKNLLNLTPDPCTSNGEETPRESDNNESDAELDADFPEHDNDQQPVLYSTTKLVGAQFILKTRDGRKLSPITTISNVSEALQLMKLVWY